MQTLLSDQALRRRVASWFRHEPVSFFVVTTPGLESFTSNEISQWIPDAAIHQEKGGLTVTGPLAMMIPLNERLLTASRVLLRIDECIAQSYPEFFQKVKRIHWEVYLGKSGRFTTDITAKKSRLHHTGNIEKSLRDGIGSYYSQWLPSDDSQPVLPAVFLRLMEDRCTFSLDTSGELLYQRGYRLASGLAPIRETLAVSMLMEAGATRFPAIVDPFCGTGTFLLEARRLLVPVPASRWRSFPFTGFPFYHEPTHRHHRSLPAEKPAIFPVLAGSDRQPEAIRKAKDNDRLQGLEPVIEWSQTDCHDLKNKWGPDGLLIMNPPWGMRVASTGGSVDDWLAIFRERFAGWEVRMVLPADFPVPAGLTIRFRSVSGGRPVMVAGGRLTT
ncbi:MAG: hypothetical protein HUU10_09550 [Bacteroidetes bacterium]|nr:hypothetical protein [Bacteroidota bacterium]